MLKHQSVYDAKLLNEKLLQGTDFTQAAAPGQAHEAMTLLNAKLKHQPIYDAKLLNEKTLQGTSRMYPMMPNASRLEECRYTY